MERGPRDAVVPEPFWLDGKKGKLAAVLYRAADVKGVLLIAPPFAEERKCSHRSLHRTAQALARNGFSCLRLDFWGMGDSQGAFEEADLETWVDDFCVGVDALRALQPGVRPGALGLRLGGSLCVRALQERTLGPCVLWQPLISGRAFLEESLKRKRIKRMMTQGKGAGAEEEVQDALFTGKVVDFDGYAVSPKMYRQLEELDLSKEVPPSGVDLLWVQMGPSESISKTVQEVTDRWREGEARIEALAVREKPFWNVIGALEDPAGLQPTVHWLEGREGTRWKST